MAIQLAMYLVAIELLDRESLKDLLVISNHKIDHQYELWELVSYMKLLLAIYIAIATPCWLYTYSSNGLLSKYTCSYI